MRTAFAHFATALGSASPPVLPTLDMLDSAVHGVSVLQDFYHAVARSDYAAVGKLLTDDIRFELFGVPGVSSAPVVGRDAVLGAFQASFEAISPEKSVIETLVTQGNQLVLIATDQGQLLHVNAPYAFRFILELTFVGSKMSRVREWVTPLSDP